MLARHLAIGLAFTALAACRSPQPSPGEDAAAQPAPSAATAEATGTAPAVDRVDYGNQHVQSPSQITWHNAASGEPTAKPAYACIQNHQIAINVTPTFKAEKIGTCPGGVLDYYKYTWKE